MAGISGYDSSSISTLFSSLNTGNKSSFGNNMLGINYTDYSCIKNGSYFKLVKAYYDDGKTIGNQKVGINSTSKDATALLGKIQDQTEDLTESAKDLYTSKTLFAKKSVTDADGNQKEEYDTDKIYSAVKKFVSDYNSVISSAGKSETTSIANTTASMVNATSSHKDMLGRIGITIDSDDYTLSIDEDKFKKADMSTVKTLFHGTGSYAYATAAKSSMLNHYAQNEAAKANTYNAGGKYANTYSSGSIYNSFT